MYDITNRKLLLCKSPMIVTIVTQVSIIDAYNCELVLYNSTSYASIMN